MKEVAIISTGNELVYGNVHEANCFYISSRLFHTDFSVVFHLTVGDRVEDIEYAVREAEKKADIAIITGGLGPTDDDHTLKVLQKIYNFERVIYETGKERMEKFFNSIDRILMENDLKQVTVPKGAVIFDNDVGLATGFSYTSGEKRIIAMPGVPVEMQYMFENKVLPFLLEEYGVAKRRYLIIRSVLVREAEVNELIKGMDINHQEIEWGITTEWGLNIITFVQKGDNEFPEDRILQEAKRSFGDRMLSHGSESLEMELINLLREKRMTIAIAESCTGGLISKRITDIQGSSDVFSGGVVAYSNKAKSNLLGVSEDYIEKYGAVSEEVAKEMAKGVKSRFDSSIGISVTGIAGPGGGSEEKPVGMVCFGSATPDGIESLKLDIMSDRERIRYFSSQHALDRVRLYLK